jgi:hypothetical protein
LNGGLLKLGYAFIKLKKKVLISKVIFQETRNEGGEAEIRMKE